MRPPPTPIISIHATTTTTNTTLYATRATHGAGAAVVSFGLSAPVPAPPGVLLPPPRRTLYFNSNPHLAPHASLDAPAPLTSTTRTIRNVTTVCITVTVAINVRDLLKVTLTLLIVVCYVKVIRGQFVRRGIIVSRIVSSGVVVSCIVVY